MNCNIPRLDHGIGGAGTKLLHRFITVWTKNNTWRCLERWTVLQHVSMLVP